MAKAIYTSSSGAKVAVEGSPEEVAELLQKLGAATQKGPITPRSHASAPTRRVRRGVVGHVLGLREVGFFRAPKSLNEVAEALQKDGHLVPTPAVAVVLLRLVRDKELQRTKEGGAWKYATR
jgi:hypothetical protein